MFVVTLSLIIDVPEACLVAFSISYLMVNCVVFIVTIEHTTVREHVLEALHSKHVRTKSQDFKRSIHEF